MYYHIVENTMRNGVKGYRLVKTYQGRSFKRMDNWLWKQGKPFWVVASNHDCLALHMKDEQGNWLYGNFETSIYNTGGWGQAHMPVMPIFHK